MNDTREDLQAAIDALEGGGEDDKTNENTLPESDENTGQLLNIGTEGDEKKDDGLGQEAVSDEANSLPASDPAVNNESKNSLKAPLNWEPQQREDWSRIPRHLQEKIIAREKEMDSVVANTSEARKVHKFIDDLSRNYAPVLAAEGVNTPYEAIEGMFRSVATLRLGSPAEKAQAMAGLVKHYGVDITKLDDALAGDTPGDDQSTRMEQLIDKKLQPINNVMQQLDAMQRQKQEMTQQEAAGKVQEFAKKAEFLQDVRNEMADLIDMSQARGREMSLEEAYKIACSMNPQISRIMQERGNQQTIQGRNNSLNRKRAAASSLNGGGQTGVPSAASLTLRDQLAAAWDDVAGR